MFKLIRLLHRLHPKAESMSPFLKSFPLRPCFALSLSRVVIIHLYQSLTLHLSPKSPKAGSPSPPYPQAARHVQPAASLHILEATGKETIALVTGKTFKVWSLGSIIWRLYEPLRSRSTSNALWKWSGTHTTLGLCPPHWYQVLELWQNPLGVCPQGCQWLSSLPFPISCLFSLWCLSSWASHWLFS